MRRKKERNDMKKERKKKRKNERKKERNEKNYIKKVFYWFVFLNFTDI